jgi:hypothetical protein
LSKKRGKGSNRMTVKNGLNLSIFLSQILHVFMRMQEKDPPRGDGQGDAAGGPDSGD